MRGRIRVNHYCPNDGTYVRVEEMVFDSVAIVVKRLPQFFSEITLFVSNFFVLSSMRA